MRCTSLSNVLYPRSNVDLKDKWRNMSVVANGLGSRDRTRQSSSRMLLAPRHGESYVSPSSLSQSDDEMADAGTRAVSGGSSPSNVSKGSMVRLENLIMEAINNLRQPGGSSKTTIEAYIEDHYWAPPNLRRALSGKLKNLSAMGKLIKVKRKFRIAHCSTLHARGGKKSSTTPPRYMRDDSDSDSDRKMSNWPQDLANLSNMTLEEVNAFAARAVAEAEKAMAAAEEALREAEEAEAEADAAEAFAEAALRDYYKTFVGGREALLKMGFHT